MSVLEDIHNDLERGAVRLVSEYREKLSRDAFALCGDAAEAEDLAFRTFERAIAKIDTFRGESSLYTWMRRILENLHRSSARRKSAAATVLAPADECLPESPDNPTSVERLLAASDAELVRQAIAALPADQREVIVLHYFMEQPVAKIAKVLAVPEGTIKFRLHVARKVLAGVLSKKLKKPLVVGVVAALGFLSAAFAAWRGGFFAASPEPSRPTDPETQMISQQKEDSMIARKMATLVGASIVSVAVPAAELQSECTFVFLRPETSSFWNTATNSTMTVPVDYPKGASSAVLTVRGLGYEERYAGITEKSFTFDLPKPGNPEQENVYDLTLTFDNGVQRTAKLGLIQGLAGGPAGSTRCLAPANSRVWKKVRNRAVLPIPYGVRAISVNGVETETGLDGAQGWYALRVNGGENVSLSLIAEGLSGSAALSGASAGFMMIAK